MLRIRCDPYPVTRHLLESREKRQRAGGTRGDMAWCSDEPGRAGKATPSSQQQPIHEQGIRMQFKIRCVFYLMQIRCAPIPVPRNVLQSMEKRQ